jgi:AcrR family transcriptional regulator
VSYTTGEERMRDSPKRSEIVRTAPALFLRHGIRKVRVEEVCAEAHVSKRTFYKYFRNKNQLAVGVLGELFDENRAQVEAVLALDCPIEDKMCHIIEVNSRLAAETSAAFYRETLDAESEPGGFVLQEQRTWDERVRRFYRDAQAQGQIRADINIDVLMVLLVRTRDLVRDPDLARLVPDLARLVEMVMKVFFYGILPRQGTTSRETAPPSRARRRRS